MKKVTPPPPSQTNAIYCVGVSKFEDLIATLTLISIALNVCCCIAATLNWSLPRYCESLKSARVKVSVALG